MGLHTESIFLRQSRETSQPPPAGVEGLIHQQMRVSRMEPLGLLAGFVWLLEKGELYGFYLWLYIMFMIIYDICK